MRRDLLCLVLPVEVGGTTCPAVPLALAKWFDARVVPTRPSSHREIPFSDEPHADVRLATCLCEGEHDGNYARYMGSYREGSVSGTSNLRRRSFGAQLVP